MIETLKKYLGNPAFKYILDETYYAQKHEIDDEDLWKHFQKYGFKQKLDPSPILSLQFMEDAYGISSISELQNFIESNKGQTSDYFDPLDYYDLNPDVKVAGIPGLKHFMLNGRFEDRLFKSGSTVKYVDLYDAHKIQYLTELSLDDAEAIVANIDIKEFKDSWDSSYIVRHSADLKKSRDIQRYSNGVLPNRSGRTKKIAIIGDLGIPQCKKYRILQKLEYFNKQGWSFAFSHWLDVPRSLEAMQDSTSVLFYRIPLTKITNGYILEARRLGISYGYDIDDPIFDLQVYSQNKNLAYIPKTQAEGILSSVEAYSAMLSSCNYVITSTPKLKELAQQHTSSPVYIWRNAVDSETLTALQVSSFNAEKRENSNKIVIGYMSGSKAHEADFLMAKDGVQQLLKNNKNIEFKVLGHSDLVKKLLKRFPNQVSATEYSDYFTYISGYSKLDLNIIPLVPDDFNDCKSAIRMMEAALMGVPTVVTNIGDYDSIGIEGQTAYFVSEHDSWHDKIVGILDKKHLKEIGAKAKEKVNSECMLSHIGDNLESELIEQF